MTCRSESTGQERPDRPTSDSTGSKLQQEEIYLFCPFFKKNLGFIWLVSVVHTNIMRVKDKNQSLFTLGGQKNLFRWLTRCCIFVVWFFFFFPRRPCLPWVSCVRFPLCKMWLSTAQVFSLTALIVDKKECKRLQGMETRGCGRNGDSKWGLPTYIY